MAASTQENMTTFLDALAAAVGAKAVGDTPLARAWRRVVDGLQQRPAETRDVRRPTLPPACAHLAACYDGLQSAEPVMRDLAAAFQAIEPSLAWSNRAERRAADGLADRYADAMIVGRDGPVPSTHVEIGISVMAPNTTYPDHRHPPEEVYIALSGGEWRQNDGPWNEPGIGGLTYNPAHIVHAMRSGDKPFLAIWCLPLP